MGFHYSNSFVIVAIGSSLGVNIGGALFKVLAQSAIACYIRSEVHKE